MKDKTKLIANLFDRWVKLLGLQSYKFKVILTTEKENTKLRGCQAFIEFYPYRKVRIIIKDCNPRSQWYWEEVVFHELLHLAIEDRMGAIKDIMRQDENLVIAYKHCEEALVEALEDAVMNRIKRIRKPS